MPKAFKNGLKTAVISEAFYNTGSLRTIYCDILWLAIGLPGGYTVGKLGKNGNLGAWKFLSLNVQPFCTTE